ncbi:ABC transporter ATP-binding protein [Phytoactinopolyspora mesophila]|uniref:Nickel import system ATP-binding protein NikD n=1 Tax=Phytoactinopolyspora mesophila TaxID=2650750 RepID=A0A7K3M9L8_9ACTN|nr:ABC transporter ATP-binding protein [Phytoactinopolyspora mesophila]NDL59989.1 ATP-binding cassette domain-containing protein [Phytoactinopolyspora mesophila]
MTPAPRGDASTPVDHGQAPILGPQKVACAHDQQGSGGVLTVEALSVRIRLASGSTVRAVNEVSFALRRGRILALVGESGCGKSVLAAAILGLLPGNAQVRGSVMLTSEDGPADLLRASEHELATRVRGRRIGLIPQSAASHLTPVRTARSQLTEVVRLLQGREAGRVEQLAEQVGLDPADLDLYPHELSGGMAQRVATALALAGDPPVILADEPTAGLDRVLVDRTVDLLRSLADDGRTVLLITHDLAAAERVADDLAVMYAGRLLELGPAVDLVSDPWHDYTRGLMRALPAGGLVPIPGRPPSLTDLPPGCAFHRRCPGECSGDVGLSWYGERAVACR